MLKQLFHALHNDKVKKVYKHEGITKDIIEMINPDRDTEAVIKELKEIGFIKEI